MLPQLSPRAWISAGLATTVTAAVTITWGLGGFSSSPAPSTHGKGAGSPVASSSPSPTSAQPSATSPIASPTASVSSEAITTAGTTGQQSTTGESGDRPPVTYPIPSDDIVPAGSSARTPVASRTPPGRPSPTTPPTQSTPTTPATSSAATRRAAAFVVSQLTGANHVEGPFGPDLGQTSDVALGLAATGGHATTLDKVLTYLAGNASVYVHGDPAWGERADANYSGPTGKLALVTLAAGRNPASFGGSDLISELKALMDTKGRFRDDSEFGDFSNPLGQAFDVLALERGTSAGAPQKAVDSLVTAQCPDGGFADAFPTAGSACTSSPDSTGLALQALVASNADCPASRALTWLKSHQGADGSFGSNAVDPTKPATGNVNSTAYAALGLNAAKQKTEKIMDYLAGAQNADGGLPIQPSGDKTSNLYATAQTLGALAGTSFLNVGPSPISASAPVCHS